jgi:hypothetical protein
MEPNRENNQHLDAWRYAWHRTPSLRERIWDFLSSRVVFLVLAIAAIVILTVAVGLGVQLVP